MRFSRRVVALLLVLSGFASACSSEPNLIVGDAVADDSAPFEAGQRTVAERPFLNYVEPDSFDPRHPGNARFVLVDDSGEPRDVGTAPYDHFSFTVSLYEGQHESIVMTMSFNNFTVNEDGRLGHGLCRGRWRRSGQLSQRSATEYLFLPGKFPAVKDLGFGTTDEGCDPDDPWIQPAGLFDGAFEFEFNDAGLTLIAEDETRWRFTQVPYQLAAWERRNDVAELVPETTTTTTAAPTTTTNG